MLHRCKGVCPLVKWWSISWITGQNVQKMQILAVFALSIAPRSQLMKLKLFPRIFFIDAHKVPKPCLLFQFKVFLEPNYNSCMYRYIVPSFTLKMITEFPPSGKVREKFIFLESQGICPVFLRIRENQGIIFITGEWSGKVREFCSNSGQLTL